MTTVDQPPAPQLDDDPTARTAAHHPMGATAQLWAIRTAFRTLSTVAPSIAARWAEALFCRPPRHEARQQDTDFLTTGRRSTVHAGSQELAVWEWGAGPVVLLVHGWGSRAGRFSDLAPALVQAGFHVVAHDGPAHGASPGRRASMPQFARAIRAVAAATAPNGLHAIVGHSLGGAAAMLAVAQGVVAHRVALLAAPADVEVFARRFADYLWIPRHTRLLMQRNLEHRFRLRWDDLHLPALARVITARGLVVHDADDIDVPPSEGEAIAAAWASAELMRTQGLAHRGILRDPAVIQRVVRFIAAP